MGTFHHLGHRLARFVVTVGLLARAGAASGSVGISPPSTRMTIEPGGYGRQTVTVVNDSPNALRGRVTLRDWTIDDGTAASVVYHDPGTQPRSCTQHLQVFPETFEVPPGTTQALELSVSLPAEATGSCFAALIVQTSQQGVSAAPEGLDVRLQLNLGHLVTVDAAGRTRWDASLGDLRVEAPTDVSPLVVRARLENVGDAGIRPETSFVVTDGKGALVATASSPPRYAQPGGALELVASFDDWFAPGDYHVLGVIDIGGGRVLAPDARFAVEDRLGLDAVEHDGDAIVVWVDNAGDVTHSLTGTVDVERDGAVVASHPVGPVLVAPHERVAVRVLVGALPSGAYRAVARLVAATGPLEAAGSFAVP